MIPACFPHKQKPSYGPKIASQLLDLSSQKCQPNPQSAQFTYKKKRPYEPVGVTYSVVPSICLRATGMKHCLQTNISYLCLVSHTYISMAKLGPQNPHGFFLPRRPRLSAIFADCKCSTRQRTMRTKSTESTIQSTWEDGRPWFELCPKRGLATVKGWGTGGFSGTAICHELRIGNDSPMRRDTGSGGSKSAQLATSLACKVFQRVSS